MKQVNLFWQFICIAVFLTTLSLPIELLAQQGEVVVNAEDRNIVFLVTTPDMKPSGSVLGDYDRVKLALAKEFNEGLRGFSQEKLAFYLFTFTTDPVKADEIKQRILRVVPDAKLTTVKQSDLNQLK